MSKVYIVCEPTYYLGSTPRPKVDLSPAEKFGQLIVLLPSSQSVMMTVPTIRDLKEKLYDFCDDDYILPVGDPVLMSMVSMIAGEQNKGRVKFLKWDKLTKSYLDIQVDTSGRAV